MSLESALAVAKDYTPLPTQSPTLVPPITGGAPVTPTEAPDPSFERLAKKETELQALRDQIKGDKAKYEQEFKTKFEEEYKPFKEAAQKFKDFGELKQKDVVAAMKLAGFNDQDILNYYQTISKDVPPEEKARLAAQEVIDQHKAESEKIAKEKAEKEQTEALTKFRTDIQSIIEKNADKYEYCKFHGPSANQLVEDTVAACLAQDNELIPIDEALGMVETYYEELDKEMSTLKKRQPTATTPNKPQVSPQPEQTTSKVVITTAPDGRRPVTMTNRLTPTIQQSAPTKNESPEDKKARLIAKYLKPQ